MELIDGQVYSAAIPVSALTLDTREVAARLHTAPGYTDDVLIGCEMKLRRVLQPRYAAVRVPISYPRENEISLPCGIWESRALYRNLAGCGEAFLWAVTLGHAVDRTLVRLSVSAVAEHFITDGLASAFAEAACAYVDTTLRRGLSCRPRFSPGYGDLPLTVQASLLAAVDAGRRLSVTLGKNLLMSPTKSVTAVMGIMTKETGR